MGASIWLGTILHRLRHTAGNRAARLPDAAAMTDIVARLRRANVDPFDPNLSLEAADEIEWLRAEVARLEYILGISTPVEVNP